MGGLARVKMAKERLGKCLEKKHSYSNTKGPSNRRLTSVIEESQIEDFVNHCKGNDAVLVVRNSSEVSHPSLSRNTADLSSKFISLPRKPSWNGLEGNADDYKELEEKEFYRWRTQLALLEESNSHLIMTPFERNLGIWRELWKGVEKADILVQVLDSRDPFFFISLDLFKYSSEINPSTRHFLLLNKADLLTRNQRELWKAHFERESLDFVFFSNIQGDDDDDASVCDAKGLLTRLSSMLKNERGIVSFVGYPNVGKSSTINTLCGHSKAGVSSTPGKTKWIQTFELGSITICDCPGLVFPNMTTSKSNLILNGILSVDQLREYLSPVQLLAERIPLANIESLYNIKIKLRHDESLAESILAAYASSRGMHTSNYGNPDMARAARVILKDYVAGKLLYCHPPPGTIDGSTFNTFASLPLSGKERIENDLMADIAPYVVGYGFKGKRDIVSGSGKKHFKMNKRRD